MTAFSAIASTGFSKPASSIGQEVVGVVVVDRQDKVRSYGAGIGYRLGRDLRIGFNVDQQRRESLIDERRYESLRYGMAVSFGQ